MDDTLRKSLGALLRPLVSLSVRRGLTFAEFEETARRCFVETAEEAILARGESVSTSKISVMTGIRRREVDRLREPEAERGEESPSFIARLLGQWQADKRFTRSRRPRPLSFRGTESEFAELVRLAGTDLNHHTVLYELERLGLVQIQSEAVVLVSRHYVSKEAASALVLLSSDTRDLFKAVEGNVFDGEQNLHACTSYDNIDPKDLPKINAWILDLGRTIHAKVREYLSRFDRDITHSGGGETGRARVSVGTFSCGEIIAIDHNQGETSRTKQIPELMQGKESRCKR